MNVKPGNLGIRNFDEGLIYTLCGSVIGNQYYLTVKGLKKTAGTSLADKVPVYFTIVSQAEIFPGFKVPAVVVKRESIDFAMDRLLTPGLAYRVPAEGANLVEINGVVGYDAYEEMESYMPVDIRYSVQVMARYTSDANVLLMHLFKKFQTPFAVVFVKDDLGIQNSYEMRVESISNISDLIDVSEKLIGWNISLKILGELPLAQPTVSKAVIDRKINFNFMEG